MSYPLDITDHDLLIVFRSTPMLRLEVTAWLQDNGIGCVLRTRYGLNYMMRYVLLFTNPTERAAFKLRWWRSPT